jgi:hypothetical protein
MAAKKLAPVHPGEVLLEEFLGPLGLSSIGFPARSTSLRGASTRSSIGSARSRQTRHFVLRASSAPRSGSG